MRLPFILVLAACLADCSSHTRVPTRSQESAPAVERSTKGFDLVSWKEQSGSWQFAILPGTNRIKSRSEFLAAPVQSLDLNHLKARLASIAPGQTVIWQALPGEDQFLPPGDLSEQVRYWAKSRGIELIITGK